MDGMPTTEAGLALLNVLAPIRSHTVGLVNDLEWQDRQAFADRIVAVEQQALKGRRVGVLTADNGEFDAYIAFFDDPVRLERAVKRLREERLDRDSMEEPDVATLSIPLEHLGPLDDDATLDRLAFLIEEGTGNDIESAEMAAERRAEELDDEEESTPVPVAPGQIGIDGSVFG